MFDLTTIPARFTDFSTVADGAAPTSLGEGGGEVVHTYGGPEAGAVVAPFVVDEGLLCCPQSPRSKLASYRHWRPGDGRQITRVGCRFQFRNTGSQNNAGGMGVHMSNVPVVLADSTLKLPVHSGVTPTTWNISIANNNPAWWESQFTQLAAGSISLPYNTPIDLEVFRFFDTIVLVVNGVKVGKGAHPNVAAWQSNWGLLEPYRNNANEDDVEILSEWYGVGLQGAY